MYYILNWLIIQLLYLVTAAMTVTTKVDRHGYTNWYLNGKLHRDHDLPAVHDIYGTYSEWYQRGKLHRDRDQPAIISGNQHEGFSWYRNGELHRDGDLPAEVNSQIIGWYQHGKLHRNGIKPALEVIGGRDEYYKYNIEYTEAELINIYERLVKFGRYALMKKIRLKRLKSMRWIHGELLCKPPKGNFLGGSDYHKMVTYFNKL